MLDGHCQADVDCEDGKMVDAGHGEKETSLILICHKVGRHSVILKYNLGLNSTQINSLCHGIFQIK